MRQTPESKKEFQFDSTHIERCIFLSKLVSLFLILLGSLAILGWILDNPILKSIIPVYLPMKANAAIAFIFIGICLWIENKKYSALSIILLEKTLAFLVFLLGLLTLFEYIFKWDLKFDELFFEDKTALALIPYPGRLAPNAALCFTLLGFCLFFFKSRLNEKWIQVLTLIPIGVSFFGFVGYIYNVKILYGLLPSYAGMAFNASIAFMMSGMAIICSRPEKGFMKILTSKNAGGILTRQLLPAAIIIPLFLGYLRLWGEKKGFYGTEFGLSLFTLSNIIIFTLLIWRHSILFYRIDTQRKEAEHELSQAYEELEERVKERTKKLQESEAALVKSNAQMKAILDGANYSIISTTLNGTITSFNRAAEKMLGYSSEEIVGKQTPAIIHDPIEIEKRAKELSMELEKNIEPGFEVFITKAKLGLSEEREWSYIRKDKSRFPVLLSITPIYSLNQEITGFLGIASDISERKKIDQMKKEFISTMSHELRTPLTSIRGSLGLITQGLAGKVPPEMEPLLKIGVHNCERLAQLINDILDIEKIELGKMPLQLKPIDLSLIVQRSIEMSQSYANQYKVRFILEKGPTGIKVNAHEDRLLQVMTNLLSNAAKFSSIKKVVTIKITRHPPFVRVSVTDYGPGIPEDFKNKIFKKFSQADSSDSRKQSGTGIGLSMCKVLIEKMEGTINFETSKTGTTFYFELKEL